MESSLLIILIAVTAIAIKLLKTKKSKSEEEKREPQKGENKYKAAEAFFTRSELSFYKKLLEATESHYTVMAKVRVADIIHPDYKAFTKEYGRAFNLISRKHIDFVTLDKDLKAKIAIELDDPSHETKKAKKNDEVKNEAFKSAGLKLIRFRNAKSISINDIKQKLGIDDDERTQNEHNA